MIRPIRGLRTAIFAAVLVACTGDGAEPPQPTPGPAFASPEIACTQLGVEIADALLPRAARRRMDGDVVAVGAVKSRFEPAPGRERWILAVNVEGQVVLLARDIDAGGFPGQPGRLVALDPPSAKLSGLEQQPRITRSLAEDELDLARGCVATG